MSRYRALENLPNLTELRMKALVSFDHEKGCQDAPIVIVTFDWGQLHALQSIDVTGPATLGMSVTSVMALPQLRYLGLHKFWPGDLATELAIKHIEAVASSQAPQVLVEISQEGLSDAAHCDMPPRAVQQYLDRHPGP